MRLQFQAWFQSAPTPTVVINDTNKFILTALRLPTSNFYNLCLKFLSMGNPIDPGAYLGMIFGLKWVVGFVLLGTLLDLIQFGWLAKRWFKKRQRKVHEKAKRDVLAEMYRHKIEFGEKWKNKI